jgi:hypothetical protein
MSITDLSDIPDVVTHVTHLALTSLPNNPKRINKARIGGSKSEIHVKFSCGWVFVWFGLHALISFPNLLRLANTGADSCNRPQEDQL